jgi:hypothetical protein
MIIVNAHQSPRNLVDSRALYGKFNRSFRYFLPYYGHVSPYAGYLLAGCYLLRKDPESESFCSKSSCQYIRLAHNRPFCALSLAWYEFVARSPETN